MKILKCERCDKTYKEGKYCLDDGQPLREVVTSDVEFKPIDTSRTSEKLKRDIRRWLNRIGVQNPDIQIYNSHSECAVEYSLGKNQYHFKSVLQNSLTNNLAAVEQFLHSRVLGIERGIETTEQAFKGYEALPDPTERLRNMTDSELRRELKKAHPDTGTGDRGYFDELMQEKMKRSVVDDDKI